MRRTHLNTLSAYWSKGERDLMFNWPSTSSDGHLLHVFFDVLTFPNVGPKTLRQALEDRGYDITTLRFSIMKDPNHPRWRK